MTPCPVCEGPIGDIPAHKTLEGRLFLCRWCTAPLVCAADGAFRLVTDAEQAAFTPDVRRMILRMQEAAAMYGPPRRN